MEERGYVPRVRRGRPSKWHPRNTDFFNNDEPYREREVLWPGWELCVTKRGYRWLRMYDTKKAVRTDPSVRIEKRGPPLPDGIEENPDQLEMDELLKLLSERKAKGQISEKPQAGTPPKRERSDECPPTCGIEGLSAPTPDSLPRKRALVCAGSNSIVLDGVRYEEKIIKRTRRVKRKRMVPNPAYRPPKKRRRKSWPNLPPHTKTSRHVSVGRRDLGDLMYELALRHLTNIRSIYGRSANKKKKRRKGYEHITRFSTGVMKSWIRKQEANGSRPLASEEDKKELLRQKREGQMTQRQREIVRLRNQLQVNEARERRLQSEAANFEKLCADLKDGKKFSSCKSTPTRKKDQVKAPERPVPGVPERDPHAELALEMKEAHKGYQDAVKVTIASVQREMARLMQTKAAMRRCRKLRTEADAKAEMLRRKRTRAESRKSYDSMLRSLTLRESAWKSFKDRTAHDPFQDILCS